MSRQAWQAKRAVSGGACVRMQQQRQGRAPTGGGAAAAGGSRAVSRAIRSELVAPLLCVKQILVCAAWSCVSPTCCYAIQSPYPLASPHSFRRCWLPFFYLHLDTPPLHIIPSCGDCIGANL